MKKSLVFAAMLAIALAACGKKEEAKLLTNYFVSCSVNKVSNWNPAGVFSGLPSAFCT